MSNFDLDNLFGDMFDEDKIKKKQEDSFNFAKGNPENMSYWLHKVAVSSTRNDSVLKIPETKILPITFEWWKWLRSDNYHEREVEKFNGYLNTLLGDFRGNEKLFMKTGVFSNKFTFSDTVIEDKNNIGRQFLDMYYVSMLVSADMTAEVVVREFIKDKEDRGKIYEGMTLHTEFRVFYDFDKREVIGVSNYWHPDVMTGMGALYEEDLEVYNKTKDLIVDDFNNLKHEVAEEVNKFMIGVDSLTGQWSVDVMKNGDDFWLIDMARMGLSALVGQMEEI